MIARQLGHLLLARVLCAVSQCLADLGLALVQAALRLRRVGLAHTTAATEISVRRKIREALR